MIDQCKPIAQEEMKNIPLLTLVSLYSMMLRIRYFEEKVVELLQPEPLITCPVHLYIGQEAIASGVCSALRKEDWVFSTHRSHGHYLAKGGDIKALMAELFCRANGCSGGKGGSMHLSSPDIGFPGSSAIVAGTIPLAVGAALAFNIRQNNNVSVSFFGDGAVGEGVFYESLNFASLKKLPVIFVCENNLYSTHMPIASCMADTEIYRKAHAFGIPGIRIDGNNVLEVYKTAEKAVNNARLGKGPVLIECMTYRWRGHVGFHDDIDKGLRNQAELDSWISRCPIKTLERALLQNSVLSSESKEKIHSSIKNEIEQAVVYARRSPLPEKSELLQNVFKSEIGT